MNNTQNKSKKILWYIFAFFGVVIGVYPLIYFFLDRKFGLLSTKEDVILNDTIWNVAFYFHILLGGLALLIGWIQFSKKMRQRNMGLHRNIGKVYIIAVLLSALSGIYIGYFATGGTISALGFMSLGIIWFSVTLKSFLDIKKGNVRAHENTMIFSYAATFAAVTLRIWLPLLAFLFDNFIPAYQMTAWMCWVPNMIVAALIVRTRNKRAIA